MTYAGFMQLVAEMRQAQKVYYKTRTPEALADAKRLEHLVDVAIMEQGQGALL